MADFDTMLAGIKQRHMRLIIDLVPSTTPPMNTIGLSKAANPKTILTATIISGVMVSPAPLALMASLRECHLTNDPSFFSGSAWQFDPTTDQYYLHYFVGKAT